MEKKTKKTDETTDWLSKFGFRKATMGTEDIPKPLLDKLYQDYFLFFSVGFVTIYMGFRKSNMATIIFGIIILIVAFVVLKLGVEHQARSGMIKEINGAIIRIEHAGLPFSNRKSKLTDKYIYIQDSEKTVYRIRISEITKKYKVGYLCLFYVKESMIRQSEGFLDCGTPVLFQITDMSV